MNVNEAKKLIEERSWFKASRGVIRGIILGLGEDCVGFLSELAERPDVIANVRVVSCEEILIPDTRPIFGIFISFKVQRVDNPSVLYHYQYFTWRQGSRSGAKGLLLVRTAGRISHLIVNTGEKFSAGSKCFDSFGGFGEPGGDLVAKATNQFKQEICEELGMEQINIEEIIDLGALMVDAGMTPNHPHIFAAVITGQEAEKIEEGEKNNPDIFELKLGTVIVPIEKLKEFVAENDDSFFLACVARLAAKGILKLSA